MKELGSKSMGGQTVLMHPVFGPVVVQGSA
jgi:hypothetical protein